MAHVTNLIANATAETQKVLAGIHPSETQHELHKLSVIKREVKRTLLYIKNLRELDPDNPDNPVTAQLSRDIQSLFRTLNHLRSAEDHLKGHNWGIFSR